MSRFHGRVSTKTKLKQGRGYGTGANFKTWFQVHEVSSRGFSTRIYGWKTGRIHHFLSLLELSYFYILELSPIVVDIREQYPLLPQEETISIAEELGIKHPWDHKTRLPVVMTIDFFVTVLQGIGVYYQARTTKYLEELSNTRVLEKFEIERTYFKKRGIDWAIVTEREIPDIIAHNVEILHSYFYPECLYPLSQEEVNYIASELTRLVTEQDDSLSNIAAYCDEKLRLNIGTCLKVAWYLIANRHWKIDITKEIEPAERLVLLNASCGEARIKLA